MNDRRTGLLICALIMVLAVGIGLGRYSVLRGGAVVKAEERALLFDVLAVTPVSGGGSRTDAWKININTADVAMLCELPGIGEAMSARIIEYRSQNGAFESIEEIMAVRGIGEGIFAKIKDYIVVE